MRSHLVVWSIVVALSLALSAQAQDARVERAVELAVIRHLAQSRPMADVAVDPIALVNDSANRLVGRREMQRAEDLRSTLGISVSERSAIVECSGKPRLCRLAGISMHLQLGIPKLDDSTAHITVIQHFNTGNPRLPLAYRRLVVVLTYRGESWVVEREEIQVLS